MGNRIHQILRDVGESFKNMTVEEYNALWERAQDFSDLIHPSERRRRECEKMTSEKEE